MSAVYTYLVKLLATFLLLSIAFTSNAESYYVSNNPATVTNVVEVIQGDKFVVNIAEPHPLAGNITIFLAEAYTPKSYDTCPNEVEQGVKAKEHISKQLTTANSIKLTHYRKTAKGAIARVSVNGSDLGEKLIADGFASAEGWYWDTYYCDAYGARYRGSEYRNQGDYPAAIFWYTRALTYVEKDVFGKVYTSWGVGYQSWQADVMNDLGVAYRDMGNNEQAFKWWKQSAELGNRWSPADLGAAYLSGEGTAVDLDQAEYWLTKAAEQDNGWAQQNLIEVYKRKGDTDKANELDQTFTEAFLLKANNGDVNAMDELGWLYSNNNKNNEQAFYWFSKCAELGNSSCMDGLGGLYMWGDGVPANLGLAEYWLTKAVDAGNEWAVLNLGELYVEGGSYPTALKWFNKALESSNTQLRANAMNGIGKLYQKEGDTRKSVIWWQQAAELGDSSAQSELGYAYLNGNGISRDLELAKKWLTKAAEQGDEWAQEGLDELNE